MEKDSDINAVDLYSQAAIHFAAKEGHLECLDYLIKKGAQVNMAGQYYNTPLHLAARQGHLDCVNSLLQHGGNVKKRERYQQTPLHSAAWMCKIDVMKVLIDKGADVNVSDTRKETDAKCVQLLIEKGAKVLKRNKNGQTPLQVCRDEDCKKLIKEEIKRVKKKTSRQF